MNKIYFPFLNYSTENYLISSELNITKYFFIFHFCKYHSLIFFLATVIFQILHYLFKLNLGNSLFNCLFIHLHVRNFVAALLQSSLVVRTFVLITPFCNHYNGVVRSNINIFQSSNNADLNKIIKLENISLYFLGSFTICVTR